MWFRWFNKEKLDTVPAIVISIGGSGAAILSETLANEYGGPVLIYDRFNMGLSDNTTTTTGTKNGMDLWLSQLDQMFDSDIVGLKGKKFHMMSFSMSTVTQFQYALKHPDRLVSVIFLSGILGSIGDPEGHKKRMAAFNNNNNDDKNGQHAMMMKFVVPALYKRAAGQVEEGADPEGLPVVRAMCRTKGFTEAFLAQMTDPTIMEASLNGAKDESCRELVSTKIPIYVRNYEDDSDVNLEGWSRIWKIFKEEGNDKSEYETKSGKHHMYYADDSAKKKLHPSHKWRIILMENKQKQQ